MAAGCGYIVSCLPSCSMIEFSHVHLARRSYSAIKGAAPRQFFPKVFTFDQISIQQRSENAKQESEFAAV